MHLIIWETLVIRKNVIFVLLELTEKQFLISCLKLLAFVLDFTAAGKLFHSLGPTNEMVI